MKILIVEQEPAIRNGLKRFLALIFKQWAIAAVDCAEEAVKILEKDTGYDLAFIDYEMAGKDGLWLIQWIRDKQLNLACILMSGGLPSIPEGIIFLAKPFSWESLGEAIVRAGVKEA